MLHQHSELQEEEFQEADILWPDAADSNKESPRLYFSQTSIDDDDGGGGDSERQAPLKQQVRRKASSPIDIPGRKKVAGATAPKGSGAPAGSTSKFSASHAGVGACSTVIGSHVFVPPHVIIDRRAKRDKAMMMLVVPSGRARARKMRE